MKRRFTSVSAIAVNAHWSAMRFRRKWAPSPLDFNLHAPFDMSGQMIAQLFGLLGTAGLCALLGACLYESVVMAPNYASQAPASLLHIRAFFRARTPAHFFRIAAPLTVLLLVVGIVLAWHLVPARWLYLAALVIFVAAEAVTFVVHYPCNKVLFLDPLSDDTALLARTAWEWARWNWVRAALLGLAIASLAGGVLSITDNFQQ